MADNKVSSGIVRTVVDVIILVLGIILVALPNDALPVITLILGIVLIGYGGISIFISLSKGVRQGLVVPVICVAVGIILLVFRETFANTVLPFGIGIWMIVMGLMSFAQARKLDMSIVNTVLSLVAVVLGIIILVGVFVGHNTFSTLLGVGMLIYGIAAVVNAITIYAKK